MKTLATSLLCLAALGATVAARADTAGGGTRRPGLLPTNSGEEIYRTICQGCHMPGGKGAVGAGRYPALAGDAALASADFVALTLITGRRNMPKFVDPFQPDGFFVQVDLDDQQVAAVVNYVRSGLGNRFKGTISVAQVKALRESLQPARP